MRAPLHDIGASDEADPFEVRFDHASGECSAGSIQLVPQDELRRLAGEWSETGDGCTSARKQDVPSSADYPALLRARAVSGGAHVLVRIDRDGSVVDARAVCATDARFAVAAESTAHAIAYAPATCAGKPVRTAFMLPFNFKI